MTRTEFGILYFYSITVDFTLAVSKTHQLFQRKYKIWGFLWRGCVERNPLCRIHWLMYRNLNKKLWLYFGLNPCLLSLFYKEIEICEWKIPHKSLLAIGLPCWESISNVSVDCRSPLSSAVLLHQRAWLCLHHSWPLYTLIFRKLS